MAVAGCASSGKGHREGTILVAVPWTNAVPPQLARRAPVATRCRASQLRLPDQVRFVPRLSGGIALVTLRNAGPRVCRLTGRPRVRFVHEGGPAQVQTNAPPTPSTFPEVPYPASSLLALRPGEYGAVTVTWDNWCDPTHGKQRKPPSAIRVTLPDRGGSLDTDYNAVPQCIDPAQPSTIGVSVFQPSLIPAGRPWTDAFLRASIPDRPLHARRGGVLRFTVVLHNLSKTPARFTHCPAYAQQLVPAGRLEVRLLNCVAAHPIAGGASMAFAMRVNVPRDAPLGHNGLFWMLDPFGQRGPELNARVDIRSG
jgi:hypothetical protein